MCDKRRFYIYCIYKCMIIVGWSNLALALILLGYLRQTLYGAHVSASCIKRDRWSLMLTTNDLWSLHEMFEKQHATEHENLAHVNMADRKFCKNYCLQLITLLQGLALI